MAVNYEMAKGEVKKMVTKSGKILTEQRIFLPKKDVDRLNITRIYVG